MTLALVSSRTPNCRPSLFKRHLVTRALLLRRHPVASVALIVVLCAFLCPLSARAQATSGSILGHVEDPSGALIVGADLTAVNLDTHISFHGRTDHNGTYVLLHVAPGNYEISATHDGFSRESVPMATIAIDEQLLQDFKLKPGSVDTVTTVSSAPTLLQTQTAETGTVIQTADILDLPLQGRQFFDLTALVPGVVQGAGGINSFNYSVNGQREYANSIQLDGIESTTNRTQDITVTPSVDSIQEFKVATSSYNAEFGKAGGGIISVQTKAGTNHIHGSAYEFYRPNFLAAEQYAFGANGIPSILKQNNYGGTIGGPIRKDRAFLFISYEGSKQTTAANGLDSVPPIGQINFLPNGDVDLSHMIDPASGTVIPIFDPNYTAANYAGAVQQFPGDVIPANRVSAAGKAVLQDFFPKPTLAGTGNGWFDNYVFHQPRITKNLNVDSRFDMKLSEKDQIFLVYHYNDGNINTTDLWDNQAVVPGAGDADQAQKETYHAQTLSATETHLFTPKILNELRAGYSHYYQGQFSQLNGHDYSTQYGFGNIAVPGYAATMGFPDIYMGTGYLTGGSSYKPFFINDQNTEVNDNLTVSQVGRHDLKFGGDFRRLNSHPSFSLFPTTYQYYGSYGFSMTSDPTYGTFIPGADFYLGGSDIADMLLGLPEDIYTGLQLTNPHTQSWEMDYYAQDTFRVSHRLTLNYGLRYGYQNPYTEANNHISNFDPVGGDILVAGVGGNSASLLQARKNNFGPRFGFDYLINDKTVVRGGYGVNYSPENDGREDYLTKNAPFADQTSVNNYNYLYSGLPFAYQNSVGIPRNTTITIPASGRIDPATLPNGTLEDTYYVNPTMKTGMSQMFNLTVQREIGSSLSLEVGYVGSLSHHLSYAVGNINVDGVITNNLGLIQELTDLGASNYNSLQVKFTKRESRNLSFLLSYTYSHNLDNGAAPFDVSVNNDLPQNPNNLLAEYGSSDSDIRHNLVFSGLYRLPVGNGQRFFNSWNRASELLLGGWQLNSIYTMRTGTPINVIDQGNPQAGTNLRPNLVGNPVLPRSQRTLTKWFNTAAFAENLDSSGNIIAGDAGRNIFSGPGYINVDFSLFKDFAISEKYKLQTRIESFNTLNTPHFSNPGGDMSQQGAFGVIQYTNGQPRVVQIAGKFIF
jgi:hypothetical protein